MPRKQATKQTAQKASERMMQRELFDPQRMQYIRDHFDELKDEISKHSRHDDETTLRQIKAFYSARKDLTIGGKQYCESPVTYCQRRGQGRYFANHGNSLQGIARTVRQCVARDLYYDMDIKNAHPVILQHMCRLEGRRSQELDEYISNRANHLAQMGQEGVKAGKCKPENADEWAKKQYLKITNFGLDDRNGEPKPDTHNLKTYTDHGRSYMEEVRALHDHFAKKNPDDFEAFRQYKEAQGKTTNFQASYMNSLMCDWENKIMQVMIRAFGLQHPKLQEYFIPCFDGVMILKVDLDGNSINYDVQAVMDEVHKQLAINVLILEKPMNDGLVLPEVTPEYSPLEFKRFEDYTLICGDDIVNDVDTVNRYIADNIFLLENSKSRGKEKHKLITRHIESEWGTRETCTEYQVEDPSLVLKSLDKYVNIRNPQYDPDFYATNKDAKKSSDVWKDPRMMPYIKLDPKQQMTLGQYVAELNKRCKLETFDRIDFIPTLKPEPSLRAADGSKIFNTFKGFPFAGKSPEHNHIIEQSHFYKYLRTYFFRDDLARFNRFLDWIADMFQDPLHLKPYTPVFIGGQGTLKSELGKFLTKILGHHNAVTIINTERYFSNFNTATSSVLLQIFEELAEDKIGHAMTQILKGEITEERVLKESKGQDQYMARNFARKILFSNFLGITPEPGERRFDFYFILNTMANNVEFFKPIIEELHSESFQTAFYNWIIEREYDVNTLRQFERSESTNKIIMNRLPQATKFLIDTVESRFMNFNVELEPPESDFKYRFNAAELNHKFREENPRLAADSLKKEWANIGIEQKKLSVERNGSKTAIYILYPPAIQEKLREHLKMKNFCLNLNEDEEKLSNIPIDVQIHNELARFRMLELELKKTNERIEELRRLANEQDLRIRSPEPSHTS